MLWSGDEAVDVLRFALAAYTEQRGRRHWRRPGTPRVGSSILTRHACLVGATSPGIQCNEGFRGGNGDRRRTWARKTREWAGPRRHGRVGLRALIVWALLVGVVSLAGSSQQAQAATPDQRAAALVARMTPDEKLYLVSSGVAGIPRLGIPPIRLSTGPTAWATENGL